MKLVSWFADLQLSDRPAVGGKGGSLGELTRAGIAVPPGFVVRVEAFDAFLENVEQTHPVRQRVAQLDADDLEAIQRVAADAQGAMLSHPLPAVLKQVLKEAYAKLFDGGTPGPVAVRSSATAEDSADASFAGLQDTLLWILDYESLERALLQCWASLYSVPSISYRRKRNMPEDDVSMAVVVQRMVLPARLSGTSNDAWQPGHLVGIGIESSGVRGRWGTSRPRGMWVRIPERVRPCNRADRNGAGNRPAGAGREPPLPHRQPVARRLLPVPHVQVPVRDHRVVPRFARERREAGELGQVGRRRLDQRHRPVHRLHQE